MPPRTRNLHDVHEQELEQRLMDRMEERLDQIADQFADRIQDLMNQERCEAEIESGTIVWDKGDDEKEHLFDYLDLRFLEPIYKEESDQECVWEEEPKFDEDENDFEDEECLWVKKAISGCNGGSTMTNSGEPVNNCDEVAARGDVPIVIDQIIGSIFKGMTKGLRKVYKIFIIKDLNNGIGVTSGRGELIEDDTLFWGFYNTFNALSSQEENSNIEFCNQSIMVQMVLNGATVHEDKQVKDFGEMNHGFELFEQTRSSVSFDPGGFDLK